MARNKFKPKVKKKNPKKDVIRYITSNQGDYFAVVNDSKVNFEAISMTTGHSYTFRKLKVKDEKGEVLDYKDPVNFETTSLHVIEDLWINAPDNLLKKVNIPEEYLDIFLSTVPKSKKIA